ncbi:MAG: hypothetical protein WDW36_004556 [Sanguina aurantia]
MIHPSSPHHTPESLLDDLTRPGELHEMQQASLLELRSGHPCLGWSASTHRLVERPRSFTVRSSGNEVVRTQMAADDSRPRQPAGVTSDDPALVLDTLALTQGIEEGGAGDPRVGSMAARVL